MVSSPAPTRYIVSGPGSERLDIVEPAARPAHQLRLLDVVDPRIHVLERAAAGGTPRRGDRSEPVVVGTRAARWPSRRPETARQTARRGESSSCCCSYTTARSGSRERFEI